MKQERVMKRGKERKNFIVIVKDLHKVSSIEKKERENEIGLNQLERRGKVVKTFERRDRRWEEIENEKRWRHAIRIRNLRLDLKKHFSSLSFLFCLPQFLLHLLILPIPLFLFHSWEERKKKRKMSCHFHIWKKNVMLRNVSRKRRRLSLCCLHANLALRLLSSFKR